jgi:hypothetical protein
MDSTSKCWRAQPKRRNGIPIYRKIHHKVTDLLTKEKPKWIGVKWNDLRNKEIVFPPLGFEKYEYWIQGWIKCNDCNINNRTLGISTLLASQIPDEYDNYNNMF